jgi:GNAT superfamily N-acetyltransferase
MVLVDEEARGRGVGTALVRHALSFAEKHGAMSVRLDATPLGKPLYERLGFAEQYRLTRYAGVLPDCSLEADPDRSRVAQAADYEAILRLDLAATSTDRRKLLLRLFVDSSEAVHVVERKGELEGYFMVRPGSDALQLGPCIASEQAGEHLLTEACRRFAGQRVFWDIPESNRSAIRLATAAGLEAERTLLRMCRGPTVHDDVQRLWASSGPELG